ncbi:MAG TPA: hypothetical protein GXZ98_00295 [Firmicutes bacterium]|jgi:Rod binding domain-containing protein|nr:hypothetical protein [Bacillota bacterium]
MKIDPHLPGRPYTPASKENKALTEEERQLREKCQEFEAILLQKMVETMLQGETNLFGQGLQGDYFRGLFAEALAKELAKDPGLGLVDNMIRSYQKMPD